MHSSDLYNDYRNKNKYVLIDQELLTTTVNLLQHPQQQQQRGGIITTHDELPGDDWGGDTSPRPGMRERWDQFLIQKVTTLGEL